MRIYRLGDKYLKIEDDMSPESPRYWDNLGKMVCWHNRYNLGDKHDFSEPNDFIKETENVDMVCLRLYLYDHSGISISTRSFNGRAQHANWDSMQVGYIYVTYEDIKKEYNVTEITDEIIDKVTDVLKGEVETYDKYLTGDIYGFTILHFDKCDKCGHTEEVIEESCWGFYGSDPEKNGIFDSIAKEWRSSEEIDESVFRAI